MKMPFEDSPSRQRIVLLLKANDEMAVSELSRELGVTNMAVRQHLIYLERRGIVEYTLRRSGIGRPVFIYRLTEKAGDIFPNAYGRFAADILGAVVELDGRDKLDSVFQMRNLRLIEEKREMLAKIKNFPRRVSALAKHLDNKGCMVKLERKDRGYRLKLFNCLLSDVVDAYPEACKFEIDLYRELLGVNVIRSAWQRDGDPACEYIITAR